MNIRPPDGTTSETDFIEFDCSGCQSRLKVPPAISGRQAKCPKCDAIVAVPVLPETAIPDSSGVLGDAPPVQVSPIVPPSKQDTDKGIAGDTGSLPASATDGKPGESRPQANDTFDRANDERLQAPSPADKTASAPPAVAGNADATQSALPPVQGEQVGVARQDAQTKFEGEDTATRRLYNRICSEIAKIFVGQDELVLGTLVALFSGGHVLIESVPGLGKTLFVRTLGKILGCDFGRIQFTADLMPSYITGAPIFNMKTQEFEFRPGPVFTQFLLADEINRSPAKTHAALLEIMQEKNVTVDGKTHELDPPFLVLATQNPIESEGTYNLPEAQLDRFLFKLVADYPSQEQEAEILQLHSGQQDLDKRLETEVQKLTDPAEIVRVTEENSNVWIDPVLVDYINKIVRLTRKWPQFFMGASPRAGIGMMQGARTLAAFYGRDFAVPDDVVQLAIPALRHRVMLTAEAEVEGQSVDQLLGELIRTVEVPRVKKPG